MSSRASTHTRLAAALDRSTTPCDIRWLVSGMDAEPEDSAHVRA